MRGWVACVAGLVLGTSVGGVALLTRVGPEVVASDLEPNPTTTPATTTTTAAAAEDDPPELPVCSPGNALAIEPATGDPATDWTTVVVDPSHALPEDFEPPDLVQVSLPPPQGDIYIRQIVVPDLEKMLIAANDNGSPLTLVSGYRSYDRQARLFQEEVDTAGEEAAAATSARPGHSEHQLGTAVDVLTPGMDSLTQEFGDTPAGQWLSKNAHKYGFVVSYPKGTRDQTCYDYEPWHLRYVGRDTAREIIGSGLTPREWMLAQQAQ